MAAPAKYSEAFRDRAYELVCLQRRSGTQAATILNEQFAHEVGNGIHESTVRAMAKTEQRARATVSDLPKAEALDKLTRDGLDVAARLLARIDTDKDATTADLLRFFQALAAAQPLVSATSTRSDTTDEKKVTPLSEVATTRGRHKQQQDDEVATRGSLDRKAQAAV